MFNKEDFQPIRGFSDVWDAKVYVEFFLSCREIGRKYGFTDFIAPVIEKSSVYERNLGEESDVVSKEIYKFKDRNDEELALRPEFTAGIARALINKPGIINNHEHKGTLKLFSFGPLFRYDRPQAGRYRQFNQVNYEIFKNNSWQIELEMFLMIRDILKSLENLKFTFKINTLGSNETKTVYEDKLRVFLEKYRNDLSEDSKRRLTKNPLRILDSKDTGDQNILKNAPKISDFLSLTEQKRFENICEQLTLTNIQYEYDQNLVRGLDYYTSTVFEFVELSSGLSLISGGRYDKMVHQMSLGKYDVPAFGFAGGVERIVNFIKPLPQSKTVLILHETYDLSLISKLYEKYDICEVLYEGGIGSNLKTAELMGANEVIIIGKKEAIEGKISIKNLKTGLQTEAKLP